jgi:hypothetical protein
LDFCEAEIYDDGLELFTSERVFAGMAIGSLYFWNYTEEVVRPWLQLRIVAVCKRPSLYNTIHWGLSLVQIRV